MGFPIRKFTDQSLFAAPHDLSQRTTSFIASQHQGIHRILLRHLIALIIDAHPSAEVVARPCARRGKRKARSLKTSLLRTHPRTWRSSTGPLTEDANLPNRTPSPACSRRRRRFLEEIGYVLSSRCRLPRNGTATTLAGCSRSVMTTAARCETLMTDEPASAMRRTSSPMMVEPDGIEPTTSCLQSTRSPN